MNDIQLGMYAKDSLEYQIRCYNSAVEKRGGPIPPEYAMPEPMRVASSEFKELCERAVGISEEQSKVFAKLITDFFTARKNEYAVALRDISEHLRAADDENELGLSRSSHGRLKAFMKKCCPRAEYKQTCRLTRGAPPTSCVFTNYLYEPLDAAPQ